MERGRQRLNLRVLLAVSFSHLLNDTVQAVIPAIYPLLKVHFALDFLQVGFITLALQLTASIFQPLVGLYADRRPAPYALAVGMAFSMFGLGAFALAGSYGWLIAAAALVGFGSSIFHPEASRVARMASGGRHGLAQSVFQVGGNAGSSFGPLLAAVIIVPYGQSHIAWFMLAALLGIVVLFRVGNWYRRVLAEERLVVTEATRSAGRSPVPRRTVVRGVVVLMVLIFSKYFYLASMTSYYTFYLIDRFDVSIQTSQVFLFLFLFSVAVGTVLGGPVGDRYGRKPVIWLSILGVAPFSLLLPHVDLFWVAVLSVLIGFILASAFSAILVYAQELMPGKVGLVAGLFFGFAFGMGGIGSAVLGELADQTSINFVFQVCAFLPLIGMLTAFLPNLSRR